MCVYLRVCVCVYVCVYLLMNAITPNPSLFSFRDIHSNCLIGTPPPFSLLSDLVTLNLATNFFSGPPPLIPPSIAAFDFRFNYFEGCDDLCCLTGDCSSNDQNSNESVNFTLPLGVTESVWTELNVTLLGDTKRIIQIETHFENAPHFFTSFACPNITELEACDISIKRDTSEHIDIVDVTRLQTGVPFFAEQNANTYRNYSYFVQGSMCTTMAKVGNPFPYLNKFT